MKIINTLILLFLFSSSSKEQIISTLAGNGTSGSAGDGSLGTSAQLYWPQGVTVDIVGNVYVADFWNNKIRKIDVNGIISTIAGTGLPGYSGDGDSAMSAELYHPCSIAINKMGVLYIADYGNNCIRTVNNGIINTIAGNGLPGFRGDGGPATSSMLNLPQAIALDGTGNLLIADYANYRLRKIDLNGIITTIAGNGINGFSGDGGPALSAEFRSLYGIAVGKSGYIYVSDYLNSRIRKIDTSGIITTFAGTTQGYSGDGAEAVSAQLKNCWGVSVDSSEKVYIADYGNNVIREVTENGLITTIAGNTIIGFSGDNGPPTLAQVNAPQGLAADRFGNIFIAERNNQRVRKISTLLSPPIISSFSPNIAPPGTTVTIKGNSLSGTVAVNFGGTSVSSFNVINDSTVTAIINNGSTGKVQIITASGKAEKIGFTFCTAALPAISITANFISITKSESIIFTETDIGSINASLQWKKNNTNVGTNSNTYVDASLQTGDSVWCVLNSNTDCGVALTIESNKFYPYVSDNEIIKVAGTGTSGYSGDSMQANSSKLSLPGDVAVDKKGNIYISDVLNSRIRKIDTTGIISTIAGNGTFSPYQLGYPSGIAVDTAGAVYIADPYNYCIKKVLPNGGGQKIIVGNILNAGCGGDGGPASSATLLWPEDVALDKIGNLYIADASCNCIRKVDTFGMINRIAGTGEQGFNGDNGPATLAQLSGPSGVVIDDSGVIYIADKNNGRIRKVDRAGTITTYAGRGDNGADLYGDGGPAIYATIKYPQHLAIDNDGNLYFGDGNLNRIRKINKNGIIQTLAGRNGYVGNSGDGGAAVLSVLNNPAGIAMDTEGNILFADKGNHQVRKIKLPTPICNSFSPTKGPSGTVVAINGRYFTGANRITFGDSASMSISVLNDSSIITIVGNGQSGDVKITTAGGTASKPGFTYVSPCYWTGTQNTSWENAGNWSCGFIPNNNTSVFINSGIVVLNSNAEIWSLSVAQKAKFTINPPYQLTVVH